MTNTTQCTLCGHPHDAHDDLPDGTRPCRSIGHPKGLTCRACKQVTSPEHVEAIMSLRSDPPLTFIAAWADYRATLDHVRQEIGDGWQAFFTDVHQAALASAFLAWQKATTQAWGCGPNSTDPRPTGTDTTTEPGEQPNA